MYAAQKGGNSKSAAVFDNRLRISEMLVYELNKFRRDSREACDSFFEFVKSSYNVQQLVFDSLGISLTYDHIRSKLDLNSYLRERSMGDMGLPHFEFDETQNRLFSLSLGKEMYERSGDLDSMEVSLGRCADYLSTTMLAVYTIKNIKTNADNYLTDIVRLLMAEEYRKKALLEGNQQENVVYSSEFFYKGDHPKQKVVSIFDGRYISCYVHLDIGDQGQVKGALVALANVSVLAKESIRELAARRLSARNTKDRQQEIDYLNKVKKYHKIYEASQRYDERVLYNFCLEMDLDNDRKISKEDLWGFCNKKKIDIQRSVSFFNIRSQIHSSKMPTSSTWGPNPTNSSGLKMIHWPSIASTPQVDSRYDS